MPEIPTQPTSNQKSINWKRILIITVIAVVVIGLGEVVYRIFQPKEETTPVTASKATQPTKKDETAGWKTYKNSKWGFLIKYPSDFSVDDFETFESSSVIVLKVNFNSSDKKLSSPPIVTLEKGGFISIYVKEVSTGNLDTEFKTYLQLTKTKSKTYTTLDGSKAIKSTLIPYENTYSDNPVIVFSVKSRQKFVLSMYAEKDSLKSINETFELMLSTFKFLD